jgi:acetyltransferase-like isoleucine patch superfamily enzyme
VNANLPPRYNPLIPALLEGRHRCRILTADYNNLDPRMGSFDEVSDVRFELLQKLVGRVGKGTFVEPPFRPDYGCNVVIGRDCFLNWK